MSLNNKFYLSTDSTSDFYFDELKKLNIHHLPMAFVMEQNGVLTEHFDNFKDMQQYDEFFAKLKSGAVSKTSMLTVLNHLEHFENLISLGVTNILHISLSIGLSPTAENAVIAAKQINEKYGKKIVVAVESHSATIGQALVVRAAVKLRDAGLDIEQVANKLNDLKMRIKIYFMVDDLFHLKRGGRVSGAKAMIGSVLNLKPILSFDINGKLDVTEKISGAKKAVASIAQKFANFEIDDEFNDILVVHTANPQSANGLVTALQQFTSLPIDVRVMGPVIGTHVGFGGLGYCYFSKK